MKESTRAKEYDAAMEACGRAEYAARTQAAMIIKVAGERYQQAIRPYLNDYQVAVNYAEEMRRTQEQAAREILRDELTRLGYIRRV